jgi:hypothetical protein
VLVGILETNFPSPSLAMLQSVFLAACFILGTWVGVSEGGVLKYTPPSIACTDSSIASASKCDANKCYSHGNGVIDRFGTFQENCDDWGSFSSIYGGQCFIFPSDTASSYVNWNQDVAGVTDGCYDNGTIASTHSCVQASCSDYSRTTITELNSTKVEKISSLWQSSFGSLYDSWTNIVSACESTVDRDYNQIVKFYDPAPAPFASNAAYYEDTIQTFSVCFSCGNGVRQVRQPSNAQFNTQNLTRNPPSRSPRPRLQGKFFIIKATNFTASFVFHCF